jgi:hypothetical protein
LGEDGHFVLEARVACRARAAMHGHTQWEIEGDRVDAFGRGVGDGVCVTVVAVIVL